MTNPRGCPANTRREHARQGGCCYSRKRWPYEILTGGVVAVSLNLMNWETLDVAMKHMALALITSPHRRCYIAFAPPHNQPLTFAAGFRGGAVVILLASHQYESVSNSGEVSPGFPHVEIVADDAAGFRVFLGDLPFTSALLTSVDPHQLIRPRFKSCPNLLPHCSLRNNTKVLICRHRHVVSKQHQYNPFTVTANFSEALLNFYFQDIPPPHANCCYQPVTLTAGRRGRAVIRLLESQPKRTGFDSRRGRPRISLSGKTCRARPLVGGHSQGSLLSPALAFQCWSVLTSLHPRRLSRTRFLSRPNLITRGSPRNSTKVHFACRRRRKVSNQKQHESHLPLPSNKFLIGRLGDNLLYPRPGNLYPMPYVFQIPARHTLNNSRLELDGHSQYYIKIDILVCGLVRGLVWVGVYIGVDWCVAWCMDVCGLVCGLVYGCVWIGVWSGVDWHVGWCVLMWIYVWIGVIAMWIGLDWCLLGKGKRWRTGDVTTWWNPWLRLRRQTLMPSTSNNPTTHEYLQDSIAYDLLDVPAAIGESAEEFGGPAAIGEAVEEFTGSVSLFAGKPAEQI
ncbi:hypothetical protein PR048_013742 [Dryococelus australis]|uniref:Uncharacterized protein n=1 Tax=Dryococelus australis TaxID=614101 RepID=A0ABQ9HTV8_9NEOP|nr:hypothetical protein PR048_013742 [Dryococelus australis]